MKENNQCAILTTYEEGGSLHHLLMDKTKELSVSKLIDYAYQIASGMNYLHSQVFLYVFRMLFIEI